MLTRKGKIVVGVIVAIITLLAFIVFRGETDEVPSNPLAEPAAVPAGFNFPLTDDGQRAAFREQTADTINSVDYCSINYAYADNRGVPIEFDALIAPSPRASQYYYKDPETGREYLPAIVVPRGGNGMEAATNAAAGDISGLGDCAPASNGQVVLAFDDQITPSSDLMRVRGIIWWNSYSVKPPQSNTVVPDIPVILVGDQEETTASQVSRPSYRHRTLNIAVRANDIIVRLSRIEWSANETRIWVELINLTGSRFSEWEGLATATLREQGRSEMTPTGSPGEGYDDGLPSDMIPAKGTGTLKGYLTFPRSDPSKRLFLSLPGPDNDQGNGTTKPITIRLPPEKNIASSDQ